MSKRQPKQSTRNAKKSTLKCHEKQTDVSNTPEVSGLDPPHILQINQTNKRSPTVSQKGTTKDLHQGEQSARAKRCGPGGARGKEDDNLHCVARNQDTTEVASLLRFGMRLDTVNKSGMTPIDMAKELSDKNILDAVLNFRINVAIKECDRGQTMLHSAVQRNDIAHLRDLVGQGFDVNAQDDQGNTPLHLVRSGEQFEIAVFLIQSGARLITRNLKGETPGSSMRPVGYSSAYKVRSRQRYTKDPHCTTKLHFRAIQKETFVDPKRHCHPSKVNVPDIYGETPLHWAVTNGNLPMVWALLRKGAKVNARDIYGRTPVFGLISRDSLPPLLPLIVYGADLWVRNAYGDSLIDVAKQFGRRELVIMFEHILAKQRQQYCLVGMWFSSFNKCCIMRPSPPALCQNEAVGNVNSTIPLVFQLFHRLPCYRIQTRIVSRMVVPPLPSALSGFTGGQTENPLGIARFLKFLSKPRLRSKMKGWGVSTRILNNVSN